MSNVLTDPASVFNNALSRYAGENLPTRMDVQDAQSVMPGMGDAYSQKMMGLGTNAMMQLGSVLKIPASRLGWPSMEPRILIDGRRLNADELGMQERALANFYGSKLMAGMDPEKAAEHTALWGAMHPQIGPEYVNSFIPRLSAAPIAEVTQLKRSR